MPVKCEQILAIDLSLVSIYIMQAEVGQITEFSDRYVWAKRVP
jgi:hypothetical protein